MSTSIPNLKATQTHPPSRKLPPLPISHRRLPSLPSLILSKSYFNVQTADILGIEKKKATDIKDTDVPKRKRSMSIKNLFGNLHKKHLFGKLHKNNIKSFVPTINKQKSIWRPSLEFICNDTEILSALTSFMKQQYNEENIFFLQSVYKLNDKISELLLNQNQINDVKLDQINSEILTIYNEYIITDSPKQINLSYECYTNIMMERNGFNAYDLNQKRILFDESLNEIEQLIQKSVLNSFYHSTQFQDIAQIRDVLPTQPSSSRLSTIGTLSTISSISIGTDLDLDMDSSVDLDVDNLDIVNDIDIDHDDDHKAANIEFDLKYRSKPLANSQNKYMISSKGLEHGYHEWTIQILKCGDQRQEFGVISNFNTSAHVLHDYGISDMPSFGSRVVYGYNDCLFYYASYNKDNSVRCNKDLTNLDVHKHGLAAGDIVKICLNLNKGNIKFYLNSKKIRKTISVEKNVKYYPIILFSGNCQYKIE